jgi:hypothetical protein
MQSRGHLGFRRPLHAGWVWHYANSGRNAKAQINERLAFAAWHYWTSSTSRYSGCWEIEIASNDYLTGVPAEEWQEDGFSLLGTSEATPPGHREQKAARLLNDQLEVP